MDNKNNKQVGGKKKIEAGGAIGAAVGGIIFSNLIQPYIKEFVNAIVNKLDYQIKNSKDGKITIPDMCQPDFPLDVETVVSLLEDKKFITATVPLQLKDANSKYKDCINNQVVGTSPKQGKRVELESIIKVRYITQEVIDASIKIFEDEEKAKAELKEQKAIEKQERRDHRKEKVSEVTDKARNTIGHIFKKGDFNDEQE